MENLFSLFQIFITEEKNILKSDNKINTFAPHPAPSYPPLFVTSSSHPDIFQICCAALMFTQLLLIHDGHLCV